MKYCQNCGNQIDDSANFCRSCGSTQSDSPAIDPAQSNTSGGRRLHCPECKSTLLSPIVETTNNGGNAVHTPVTRNVGFTTYTTYSTHRNYWMCQSCGTKFRNLQNLKEEIVRETKRMKASLIWGIIMAAAGLLGIIAASADKLMSLILRPTAVLSIIAAVIFLCVWLTTKSKVNKMTKEKEYLEVNCFSK